MALMRWRSLRTYPVCVLSIRRSLMRTPKKWNHEICLRDCCAMYVFYQFNVILLPACSARTALRDYRLTISSQPRFHILHIKITIYFYNRSLNTLYVVFYVSMVQLNTLHLHGNVQNGSINLPTTHLPTTTAIACLLWNTLGKCSISNFFQISYELNLGIWII